MSHIENSQNVERLIASKRRLKKRIRGKWALLQNFMKRRAMARQVIRALHRVSLVIRKHRTTTRYLRSFLRTTVTSFLQTCFLRLQDCHQDRRLRTLGYYRRCTDETSAKWLRLHTVHPKRQANAKVQPGRPTNIMLAGVRPQ